MSGFSLESTLSRSAQESVSIKVFHDERILQREQWLYHGMLFVPVRHEEWLLRELKRRRGGYDGFIHFNELGNPPAMTTEGKKTHVAREWARFFRDDTRHVQRVRGLNNFSVSILGIDLSKLNRECFGRSADQNIFNRFFRTALVSGINTYYRRSFDLVHVERVFHGTRDVSDQNPLLWHPMWRIAQDTGGRIQFGTRRLTLIAADHRAEPHHPDQSQLIQFIDVIMGATSQCLDRSSRKRGCDAVAEEVIPVAERLTSQHANVRGRYYGKYGISFFPSQKLTLDDLATVERHRSTFYANRRLQIRDRKQGKLPFTFN